MAIAAAAGDAFTAGDERVRSNKISHLKLCVGRFDRADAAAEFVTNGERFAGTRVYAGDDADIGTAQPAGMYMDERLLFANLRDGGLYSFEPMRPEVTGGPHSLHVLSGSPIAR